MILNIHQKSRIIENEKIPWDTIVNQVLLSLQSNFGGDPGDGIHRSMHPCQLSKPRVGYTYLGRAPWDRIGISGHPWGVPNDPRGNPWNEDTMIKGP